MENPIHVIEKITDFLSDNAAGIVTMATGIAVGNTDAHMNFQELFTDLYTLEVLKAWVGIAFPILGFGLMVYNTFFKKPKKNDTPV
jgi:hypothetical protein